jgi:hypothetical protein
MQAQVSSGTPITVLVAVKPSHYLVVSAQVPLLSAVKPHCLHDRSRAFLFILHNLRTDEPT